VEKCEIAYFRKVATSEAPQAPPHQLRLRKIVVELLTTFTESRARKKISWKINESSWACLPQIALATNGAKQRGIPASMVAATSKH
jgi:hypothetical protein